MSDKPKLIDVIGAELAARSMNWTRLSELTGFESWRLSRWKAGTGEPDFQQTLKIARAIGLSLDEIARRMGETPPFANQDEELLFQLILSGPSPIGVQRAVQLIWLGERALAEGWKPSTEETSVPEREKPRVAPVVTGVASRGSIRKLKPKDGGKG